MSLFGLTLNPNFSNPCMQASAKTPRKLRPPYLAKVGQSTFVFANGFDPLLGLFVSAAEAIFEGRKPRIEGYDA